MSAMDQMIEKVKGIPRGLVSYLEKWVRKLPSVKKEIDSQTEAMIDSLQPSLKPYTGQFNTYTSLPTESRVKEKILSEIKEITSLEKSRWQKGYVSGAVYHGDNEHIDFLNRVYALQSQSNPLHSDLFPSASKFESEIVSMTAHMLGANQTKDDVCGVVSSGGTESILLAMKTYRDRGRELHNIFRPNIVIPVTAHAAFDKAGEYFKIKIKRIPVDENYQADLRAIKKASNGNTICIVGSAPNFPNGIVDPIEKMSEISLERGIGFHVDACLGGFVLPFAEKLGYPIKPFDFRLPGVTSMSADTHKYGYAPKGTSVILYRNPELRQYQYYTIADWPGGLYFSPTFAGSRPGALSAACWAAMLSMGEDGYKDSIQKILETAKAMKKGIDEINELKIIGEGHLLEELISISKNMKTKVTFLGRLPNDKLSSVIQQSDIFILPSLYEGMPKTLLEAMSCGMPCIGANSEGIKEIIKNKENGILCEHDANSIADALLLLYNNEALRNKIKNNARVDIEKNYNLNKVVDLELNIYKELLTIS